MSKEEFRLALTPADFPKEGCEIGAKGAIFSYPMYTTKPLPVNARCIGIEWDYEAWYAIFVPISSEKK